MFKAIKRFYFGKTQNTLNSFEDDQIPIVSKFDNSRIVFAVIVRLET